MQKKNETESWNHVHDVEKRILRPDISVKESQELYSLWAKAGTYDKVEEQAPELFAGPLAGRLSTFGLAHGGLSATQVLGKSENYKALDKLRSAVEGLFPQKDKVLILDIGAGTGLTGKTLQELGYTNIHALEPNRALTQVITEKGYYKQIISEFIGGDKPLNVLDDTYDAVVTSGAFGPGHIPCSAVPEIIRIVKPGGYFVNCMREEYNWTVPEYKGRLEPLLEKLETQGRWKKLKREIYPNHFGEKTGILMVYQMC